MVNSQFSMLRKGGRVVLVGLPRKPLHVENVLQDVGEQPLVRGYSDTRQHAWCGNVLCYTHITLPWKIKTKQVLDKTSLSLLSTFITEELYLRIQPHSRQNCYSHALLCFMLSNLLWLLYIARFGCKFLLPFRLQTKWLHYTMQNVSIAWGQIQIPIITAEYRNGIRIGGRICECKQPLGSLNDHWILKSFKINIGHAFFQSSKP